MSNMKPLPETLRKFLEAHPDQFDEGWTERDYSEGDHRPWSHWVYLKPGWHNAVVDPHPGLHIIHESSTREVKYQFARIKPCNCDDCEAEKRKAA